MGVNQRPKMRAKKAALWERQGGRCHYCARPMTFRGPTPGEVQPDDLATIDHVTPISRGGDNGIRNLVLACHRCNNAKSARLIFEFRTPSPLSSSRKDVR
jgi:5-methylcytosine-specific restriction endonuclease McrA